MMVGIGGSHRTGKTSLARRFAEVAGMRFAETSVSAMFEKFGFDPKVDYPITERLAIQAMILEEMERFYAANRNFTVVDRTPLDMAAYMLADVTREKTSPVIDDAVQNYMDRCFDLTRRYFSGIVIVQPGIPLIEAEGKAPAVLSYMEHINLLCLGFITAGMIDRVPGFLIPRYMTDLEDRTERMITIVSRLHHPANFIQVEQCKPS